MSSTTSFDYDNPLTIAERWRKYVDEYGAPDATDIEEIAFYEGAAAMLDIAFIVWSSAITVDRGAEMWKLQRECSEHLDQMTGEGDDEAQG